MSEIKFQLKKKVLTLRRQGLSYREIMEQVPVAKSTISEWLHSVGLSKYQKQRLTEKKLAAAKRGAEAKHVQRIARVEEIMSSAQREIGKISRRELWLIGTMLYWAEGSKEKDYRPGSGVRFTNGDPKMICLFLRWLEEICNKRLSDIIFDIYIHALQKERTIEIIDFWSKTIGCGPQYLKHIYYKKGNPKTLRKNIEASYRGIVRISVKSSSTLHRQIAGWTQGVVDCFR